MNSIRQALADGKPAFGLWVGTPSPLHVEALGRLNFDWICFDGQHGGHSIDTLVGTFQALQASGSTSAPVVRVPWNDPASIMKVLDYGGVGVIVPMVSTKAEAEAAAFAMRYPPAGGRSMGPTRPRYGWDVQAANDDVFLLVMIETKEGLENVEEIAAVPGVDGLFIGPADLALSIGTEVDMTGSNPVINDAFARCVEAANRNGKIVGSVAAGNDHIEILLEQGLRFVMAGSDVGYIAAGAQASLEKVKGWKEQFAATPA